jgi:hypothetical protein
MKMSVELGLVSVGLKNGIIPIWGPPPHLFTISGVDSSTLVLWLVVVPSVITVISIAFCVLYRYTFNIPLRGGDGETAVSHSGAWDRPLDREGTARTRSDLTGGNQRSEKPYKPEAWGWGYHNERSSPYAVQLSGQLRKIDPKTGTIR